MKQEPGYYDFVTFQTDWADKVKRHAYYPHQPDLLDKLLDIDGEYFKWIFAVVFSGLIFFTPPEIGAYFMFLAFGMICAATVGLFSLYLGALVLLGFLIVAVGMLFVM